MHVTFTDDGSTVMKSVTQQAVQAGKTARLIIRASGEVIAAPVVLAPIEGRETRIAVSPDTDAQAIVDLILKH
ncbi:hypothetical protein QN358_11010 [Subtercola sp. RTI3]|nr:hypothetical protein [Subtercola sp. RTI3]